MVHYPTRDLQRRLGLLKQRVTIYTIISMMLIYSYSQYNVVVKIVGLVAIGARTHATVSFRKSSAQKDINVS